jgi:progressive ankylosis protein
MATGSHAGREPARTADFAQKDIFAFWYPLALSWIMMSIAGPVINAGITRLPDPTRELAAFGVAQPVAILIESPIIYLLSATVALVRNRETFRLLRRFMRHLALGLTAVSILIVLPPCYGLFFEGLLDVSPEIAATAHPAMILLILWPAAIAWRRFYQGILIQHGHTRLVTLGTVCRLLTLATTVAVCVWWGGVSGTVMGGLALVLSVIVEAAVISWWARPVVRRQILERDEHADPPEPLLRYRGLARFYLPLALTDVMRVATQPVLVAGIARAANPDLSLAAWPVAYSLAGLLSSAALALQEVVIALLRKRVAYALLRRFVLLIGAGLSGLLALIVFSPLERIYFQVLLNVPPEVEQLALQGARILVLLPMLFAIRNLYRGRLIHTRATDSVQLAMAVNLVAIGALLFIGVTASPLIGVVVAAGAMLLAHIVEVLVLRYRMPAGHG